MDVFKRFDAVIARIKSEISSINRRIIALTVLVAIFTLATAYMEVHVKLVISTSGFVILFVLINSTIIFAVFHIRSTIKQLKGG